MDSETSKLMVDWELSFEGGDNNLFGNDGTVLTGVGLSSWN